VRDPLSPGGRSGPHQSGVRALARTRGLSSSKVIADLVETGLAAKEREKERFFELAERLARSTSRVEQKRIKAELARLTFGG
jgi:hypothetical protein